MADYKNTLERQHSILLSTVFHLLPGVLILVFFLLVAPLLEKSRVPSFLALLLGIAFVLVPFELESLLFQAKKLHGMYSLKRIVKYREPLSAWQYAALAIPLFGWSGLMMMQVFVLISV